MDGRWRGGSLSSKRTICAFVFFFKDTATTEIYTLSLHDALPISRRGGSIRSPANRGGSRRASSGVRPSCCPRHRRSCAFPFPRPVDGLPIERRPEALPGAPDHLQIFCRNPTPPALRELRARTSDSVLAVLAILSPGRQLEMHLPHPIVVHEIEALEQRAESADRVAAELLEGRADHRFGVSLREVPQRTREACAEHAPRERAIAAGRLLHRATHPRQRPIHERGAREQPSNERSGRPSETKE